MQILLNGAPHALEGETSVRELLESLELDARRVAVEVNRRILKRSELSEIVVRDGDAVEVVTFVGGG
jgi:thiamine biosynthesis protein ThiS